MKLNIEQRKSLSNYSGNLSIAWFAAGVISPFVVKQSVNEAGLIIIISILISLILFVFMIAFVKKESKKRK